jgi:hypothetical protein
MKYIIEVKELDSAPKEFTNKDLWPGPGLYKVKDENYSLYHVHATGVNYLSCPDDLLTTPYQDRGEAVSESLLLRAIAAASRAEVLK